MLDEPRDGRDRATCSRPRRAAARGARSGHVRITSTTSGPGGCTRRTRDLRPRGLTVERVAGRTPIVSVLALGCSWPVPRAGNGSVGGARLRSTPAAPAVSAPASTPRFGFGHSASPARSRPGTSTWDRTSSALPPGRGSVAAGKRSMSSSARCAMAPRAREASSDRSSGASPAMRSHSERIRASSTNARSAITGRMRGPSTTTSTARCPSRFRAASGPTRSTASWRTCCS